MTQRFRRTALIWGGTFMKKILFAAVFLAGLLLLGNPVGATGISGAVPTATPNTEPQKIFDNGVWWISKGVGPVNQESMPVYLNGNIQGTTYALEIGHQASSGWPVIAVFYNTGYVRLTPPGNPFGTSFVLGPGYWDNAETYTHNVQITRVDIDTSLANPSGAIRMRIFARDYQPSRWPLYNLDITYGITLPDPASAGTAILVTQSYTTARAFSISASRQALHEGFKLVQFSSMYIDGTFHDSDGARYIDSTSAEKSINFADSGCGASVFTSPNPLSVETPWLEVQHSDDLGWQGNTPNAVARLVRPGSGTIITPQGYVTCSTNENDDNVGVWLNDDSTPMNFTAGMTADTKYILRAQDNPDPIPTPVLQTYNSIGSQDGWILESSESSGKGGTLNSTAGLNIGDDATDKQYRAILSFDTTSLPDNALIVSAELKIKKSGLTGSNPFATHQSLLADIKRGALSGNNSLQLGDFNAKANQNAALIFSSTSVDGWYSALLNNLYYSYINLGGMTQFRVRFKKDDNDDMGADIIKFYSGNYADSAYWPQLIIEYYVP
jgi:hypothetical protein